MRRNYGIDLLRLVLMFMIVMGHVMGHGGILYETTLYDGLYYATSFVNVLCYCTVNCFAIISGYVQINGRFRFSSLVMIVLQGVFFSLGISVCKWIADPASFGVVQILEALFPVSNNVYWYLTCYVGMYLFVPVMNAAICALSDKKLMYVLVLLLGAFSVFPTVTRTSPVYLNWGCSVVWLMVCYMIGACMKRMGIIEHLNAKIGLWVYLCAVLVSWIVKIVMEWLTMILLGAPMGGSLLAVHVSPTMVLAALGLLVFFANMKLPEKWITVISKLSPAAFGVYLIHEHPYFRQMFITGRSAAWADDHVIFALLKICAMSVLVFVFGLGIELLRLHLFRALHIKDIVQSGEQKIRNILDGFALKL